LKANCASVDFVDLDRLQGIEAEFLIELNEVSRLEATGSELRLVSGAVQLTFGDHRGVI
jgi:hypothetical protein